MSASAGRDRGVDPRVLSYRLHRLTSGWELTPLNGAVLYLLFGFSALYVSDVLFVRYFSEPFLSQLQALKAGVEVLLTGLVVFLLVRASRYPLERTNRDLRRRRDELQVLHRVLRHNLRNDLNVITALTDSLRRDVPQEKRDDLDRIRRSTEDILHYTQQASRIRRVAEGDGDRVTYELGERVPRLLETHERVSEDVDLSVHVPEEAAVEVNHMFGAALEELIANAIEHNDSESPQVSVSVSDAGEHPGMTDVCVADDGPGIPEHVPRILSRSGHDPIDHLEGMGLWFVYWTVTESGGELLIEDSDLGGSRVRLRVPRALPPSGGALTSPAERSGLGP